MSADFIILVKFRPMVKLNRRFDFRLTATSTPSRFRAKCVKRSTLRQLRAPCLSWRLTTRPLPPMSPPRPFTWATTYAPNAAPTVVRRPPSNFSSMNVSLPMRGRTAWARGTKRSNAELQIVTGSANRNRSASNSLRPRLNPRHRLALRQSQRSNPLPSLQRKVLIQIQIAPLPHKGSNL